LGLNAFIDLDGLLRRIEDHPAVGALGDMLFQLVLEFLVDAFVEIIV